MNPKYKVHKKRPPLNHGWRYIDAFWYLYAARFVIKMNKRGWINYNKRLKKYQVWYKN